MKLLMTSAGVRNEAINDALVEMLGKPISESAAVCIPTAEYQLAHGFRQALQHIIGPSPTPMFDLDWKTRGLLELTALPTVARENWVPMVREADAILVAGGDPLYLSYWMQKSGFMEVFPTLSDDTVYMGVSAGSMVLAPRIGEDFVNWRPPHGGDDSTLGIVEFGLFPHLNNPHLPENTMAAAEQWAANLQIPAYAVEDGIAIKVIDGNVDVVGDGDWRLFNA